jgi:uncharacterized membrane protein HdeD (DUF308 family)
MELSVDRNMRHWWVFLIRGVLFILLGVYMILSPASSYAALGFLLGLTVFIVGVAELLRVVRDPDARSRGWHLMLGLIDILLGVILMGHIAASEIILRIIVGIWFLFGGISVFRFSHFTGGRSWVVTLGGVLIILFALLILFNPVFGAMTIVLWTGIAFIITGIFYVALGYRVK